MAQAAGAARAFRLASPRSVAPERGSASVDRFLTRSQPGQATTIEQILNGVVVGFEGVAGNKHGFDLGVWDNAARIIPLFP